MGIAANSEVGDRSGVCRRGEITFIGKGHEGCLSACQLHLWVGLHKSQLTKSDAPLPPAHNCRVYVVKSDIDGLPVPSANVISIVLPDITWPADGEENRTSACARGVNSVATNAILATSLRAMLRLSMRQVFARLTDHNKS